MSGFYLFLSSADSTRYHPTNTFYDFIVELGREYDLREEQNFRRDKWSMALVEISLESDGLIQRLPEDVIVLCDLASPSFIQGTERSVLSLIQSMSDKQFASLHHPYYIGVNKLCFSRLRIELVGRSLKPLDLSKNWPESSARLTCIIHFQKE